MTEATDLKTIFLKSPWKMDVEICVTLWYMCLKKIFFRSFDSFLHLFQPFLAPKLSKLSLNFFFFNDHVKTIIVCCVVLTLVRKFSNIKNVTKTMCIVFHYLTESLLKINVYDSGKPVNQMWFKIKATFVSFCLIISSNSQKIKIKNEFKGCLKYSKNK